MNTIRFDYNAQGVDKTWNFEKLTTGFEPSQGTLHQVMEHIIQGHALSAGQFGGKRRAKANVIGAHWIMNDIDNSTILTDKDGNPLDSENRPVRIGNVHVDIHGNPHMKFNDKGEVVNASDGRKAHKIYKEELTLEQALEHPFVKAHCALIYTSASHTPEWHRFRMVFLLPEYIESVYEIEAMVELMHRHFPHDPACKDAGRIFYGNTNAEMPLVNPDAYLPECWVPTAQQMANDRIIAEEEREEAKRKKAEQYRDTPAELTDKRVQKALEYIPQRQPGTDNYEQCTKVLMALHSHYGDAAEAIAEAWSPSIPGTTWNIGYKLRSYKRSGITLGSLFHIAAQNGFDMQYGLEKRDRSTYESFDNYRSQDRPKTAVEIGTDDVKEGSYEHFRLVCAGLMLLRDPIERTFRKCEIAQQFSKPVSLVDRTIEALQQREPTGKTSFTGLELRDAVFEAERWLVPRFVPGRGLTMLAGYAKDGKTTLMYELIRSMLTGGEFLGEQIDQPKRILFVECEEDVVNIQTVLDNIGVLDDVEAAQRLRVETEWDIYDLDTLELWINEHRPDFIIFDSLRKINKKAGDNENSQEFSIPLQELHTFLKHHGVPSLVIHHTNKSQEARGIQKISGNNALSSVPDNIWMYNRNDTDPESTKRQLSMFGRQCKGRFVLNFKDEWPDFRFEVTEAPFADGLDKPLRDRILSVIQLNQKVKPDGLTANEIHTLLQLEPGNRSHYKQLKFLVESRIVTQRRCPSGSRARLYSLPPSPPNPSTTTTNSTPETLATQSTEKFTSNSPAIHPVNLASEVTQANPVEQTGQNMPVAFSKTGSQNQDSGATEFTQDHPVTQPGEFGVNLPNAELASVPDTTSPNTPWGQGGRVNPEQSDRGGVAVHARDAAPRLPKRNPPLLVDPSSKVYANVDMTNEEMQMVINKLASARSRDDVSFYDLMAPERRNAVWNATPHNIQQHVYRLYGQ